MTKRSSQIEIQQAFDQRLDRDKLLQCMRCGFCLPTCPTYIASGYKESHSPRGRIALMKAVADGEKKPDEDFYRTIETCLDCRACEAVCPSGVEYGELIEEAKQILFEYHKESRQEKIIRSMTVRGLFPHPGRLNFVADFTSFYQRSGLQKLAHGLRIMNLFPTSLQTMEAVLPNVHAYKKPLANAAYQPLIPAVKKYRVAFFEGCLMGSMFQHVNSTSKKLLELAGCEVISPKNQICCGALADHSGEKDLARKMAQKNIEIFETMDVDFIVNNAGGCEAELIEYPRLLKDDPDWLPRAEAFSAKVKDLAAILVQADFTKLPLSLPTTRITYQDSCHQLNVVNVAKEPRALLQHVQGVELVEMEERVSCCGSAGIYNMVEPEAANEILDIKMQKITAIPELQYIITANPGCFMQMNLGVHQAGIENKVQVLSLSDFLMLAVDYSQK
ncbi:(Fe-S)-binding protein [Agrilactobacillus yilanensis]|uniref:Glycolate oxidase iron-sulfur subunit n=1 Tax=Agrilactobacillus yilanensis TaxID=2485997 RepID=A0ABW4J9S2_9LACO|nr:(Fe-S)-binding protein [Agrilactobacillus yilanensis]